MKIAFSFLFSVWCLLSINLVSAGPSEESMFNWAEATFPEFFSPAGAQTQIGFGYVYRYYSGTNTYAGTKDGRVYVLGDAFGGLLDVGSVSEVLDLVAASNPNNSFSTITALTVRNDQNVARQNAVAYAGIPISQSLQLLNTNNLAIIDSNNQRIPAQFNVISRWGGVVDNAALPIRWLEVSFSANVNANSSETYLLGRDNNSVSDSSPVSITASGDNYIVNTGAASFTLNPSTPALFSSITLDGNSYTVSSGAGPKLTLANSTQTTAQLDSNSFKIHQVGPVKVVVSIEGHFIGTGTQCQVATGNYESQAFTLVATFSRGQSYVDLQFNYRNECSDAFNEPWTDQSMVVDQVSFELPLSLSGNLQNFYATNQGVQTSTAQTVRVVQQQGSGTPWQRQARVQLNGVDSVSDEKFDQPFVAMSNGQLTVGAQLAWMRFREPQALQVSSSGLSLQFVSQTLTIGEARGIWNFARIHFTNTTDTTQLGTLNQQGIAALERGLIPRTGQYYLNTTQVFANLGNEQTSQVKTDYLSMMEMLHNDTINSQWSNNRTYGSQLWPDIQFDAYPVANPDDSTPSNNAVVMNYWNPSRNELLEFLRAGDVKWVWDFAMPQSWYQLFSAYANIGEHEHGNRNGFALISGGCGRSDGCAGENDLGLDNLGHWNRSGFGSDDYTYTHGNIAYVLRPNYPLLRRFAQAGKTVINRYVDSTAEREQYVSQRVIQRQTIQHFALLANCAEFVSGSEGQACHNKLSHIMQEFNNENFASGYMCSEDTLPATECDTPQQFMQNSLMYPFFYRMYLNYGNSFGTNLRYMLANAPWTYYYQHNRPSQTVTPNYSSTNERTAIALAALWPNELRCQYDNRSCNVNPFNESQDSEVYAILEPNKAQTMGFYLMAEALDSQVSLCQTVKTALQATNGDVLGSSSNTLYLQDLWFSNANQGTGWSKGTSQMMQNMAFTLGLYDTCQ